jgi:hypothetical protein
MNIKDKIGSIALSLGVSFSYAKKSEQNINADDIVFPNILLIEPDQFGRKVSLNGSLRRYTNLFIQFTTRMPDQEDPTKDEIGRDANYRNAMIEQMQDLADSFIYAILNDEDFENISEDIRGFPIMEAYDANVFGVEFNIPKLIHTFPLPC